MNKNYKQMHGGTTNEDNAAWWKAWLKAKRVLAATKDKKEISKGMIQCKGPTIRSDRTTV